MKKAAEISSVNDLSVARASNIGGGDGRAAWREMPLGSLVSAIFAAVLTAITTPWLAPAAVGLLVVTLGYASRHNSLSLRSLPPWLVAMGGAALYIFMSTGWSADPRTTLVSGIAVAVLSLCVHCSFQWCRYCSTTWLEHMTRAVLFAFVAALLYLLVEELTSHAIKRGFVSLIRVMRGQEFGLPLNSPQAPVYVPVQHVKWRMPPLDFLLWPTLLIISRQYAVRAALILQFAICALTVWVIVLSDHKTSLVAIAAAMVVFVLAHWRAVRVRQALVLLWVLGFLAIIPLALASFQAGLHLDRRIGPTLQARIILWNHTAKETAKQPLLGVGAAATRLLDRRDLSAVLAAQPKHFVYAERTGPHAHNIFLQSIFELGVTGAALFLFIGVLLINGIARMAVTAQPYLLATATTVIVTGASSFGLFEVWFMAVFALCQITMLMASEYQQRVIAPIDVTPIDVTPST